MFASRKNIFFYVILMLIYEKCEAHPPTEPSYNQNQQQLQPQQEHSTRSFRNALNQQSIQSLLQSIENRLGNLDQIYSNRYSQRYDLNTDQYVRKIEMLESKLMRLESTLDAQLAKLSENLSSKNFRDDITKDQIFRKIDAVYERFSHKLTYMEGKFDIAFLKLQNIIDIGATKIERSENSINLKHADMEAKISEGVQIIKIVKNNVNSLEEKIINVTRVSLHQNLEKIDAVTNLAKSLANIEDKFVNISLQNKHECLNNFTKKEPSNSNKINNMYNELWKKSNIIESSVKNSLELMNLTRKEIQDIKEKTTNPNTNQNDDTLRNFYDMVRKMENNFKSIMATQSLFLESCKRIQLDETQLETKISSVLEELLDYLTNRNLVSVKELQNTEETIRAQSYNMEHVIKQNTNTVMKLSEKTSEDRKEIEKILSTVKEDLANFMTTIEHEINLEGLERSHIGNLISELQAQVNDLDRKMNKNNMNYNAKQMLQGDGDDDDDGDDDGNVLRRQTKDTFEKQVNISALHNTINKVDDSVKGIHQLLNDINIKINKYVDVHKLNASQINFDYEAKTTTKPADENVDIVFGESDKNTIHLFRYNYSVIDDNGNNKTFAVAPIDNSQINLNNSDDVTEAYTSSSPQILPEIPEASTIAPIIINNDKINLNNNDDISESSSVLQKKFFESPKYRVFAANTNIGHYDEENKNKLNYTNNIISIDNNTEYVKMETSTNKQTLQAKDENTQQTENTSDEYFSYSNSHENDSDDQYPDSFI